MGLKLKQLGGCLVIPLLSIASFAATKNDLRLVEAVKNRDHDAIRSLLKQHLDVNAAEGDGATALAWAAHGDDVETADLLIRAGAKVNAANDYGVTPLSLACLNGDAAMVEKLLAAGANPDSALKTGETPLMTASRDGKLEAAKLLLAHGAHANAQETSSGQTALMWAVAENHAEVVQALIEHGADVHARSKGGFTPLLFAAQQGGLDSARILLASGAGVNEATPEDGSPLVVASAGGREELAIFLLEKGADPNATDRFGITPLHYTALKGLSIVDSVRYGENEFEAARVLHYLFRPNMHELAKALLAHGANPNARIAKDPLLPASWFSNEWNVFSFKMTSPVGATPFLLAAASYDADLMRILADTGADPLLATKDNTTPLIMAAGLGAKLGKNPTHLLPQRPEQEEKDAVAAVKLAVELGANVNAANDAGQTALLGAAYVGSTTLIQFLVDKGAKIDTADKFGWTALRIALNTLPTNSDAKMKALADHDLRPYLARKNVADLLLKLGATPLPPSEAQVATKGN